MSKRNRFDRIRGVCWSFRRDCREIIDWREDGSMGLILSTLYRCPVDKDRIFFCISYKDAVMLHKRLGQAIEWRRERLNGKAR